MGRRDDMAMQARSKVQLQQQVFELQAALKKKDSLIVLMNVEIQNLRWQLQKECEQTQMLRQQLFEAQIIDEDYSEPSELMAEETKRDKQVMMFAVSTGKAAKNAQRLKQNTRHDAVQNLIQSDVPDFQIPSASPCSQPM
jgi:hypothetical protein